MYNFYIYKVTDKTTRQFYIGSQCRGKTIGVDYFTSSSNKDFKNKFKKNPTQFEIKIIGVFADANACVLQENIFIKDNIKNSLCLNKSYTVGNEVQFTLAGTKFTEEHKKNLSKSLKGREFTEEWRRNISKSKIGRIPWNSGVSCSEEVKEKISKANKGKISPNKGTHLSDKHKLSLSKSLKGREITEEWRRKISSSCKGMKKSDETKRKMSESCSNKKKVMCVETGFVYDSVKEAAKAMNLKSHIHISECARGMRKKAAGFHWQFI